MSARCAAPSRYGLPGRKSPERRRRRPSSCPACSERSSEPGVRYVLIGELAEVLRASPLLPITGTVTIVPRPGQRKRLGTAIAAVSGRPAAPAATPAIDAPASFTLENHSAELLVHPAPAGTQAR